MSYTSVRWWKSKEGEPNPSAERNDCVAIVPTDSMIAIPISVGSNSDCTSLKPRMPLISLSKKELLLVSRRQCSMRKELFPRIWVLISGKISGIPTDWETVFSSTVLSSASTRDSVKKVQKRLFILDMGFSLDEYWLNKVCFFENPYWCFWLFFSHANAWVFLSRTHFFASNEHWRSKPKEQIMI